MKDYETINKSITEKFIAIGIECSTGLARLIDYKKSKAYTIEATFSKGRQELKIPYRLGIGLFKRKDIDNIYRTKPRNGLKDTLSNAVTQRYFKPAEILARACWEAAGALEMVVEDYCSEFYEHADSFKGREVHAQCIRQYTLLSNLIGREKLEEFANLYGEL